MSSIQDLEDSLKRHEEERRELRDKCDSFLKSTETVAKNFVEFAERELLGLGATIQIDKGQARRNRIGYLTTYEENHVPLKFDIRVVSIRINGRLDRFYAVPKSSDYKFDISMDGNIQARVTHYDNEVSRLTYFISDIKDMTKHGDRQSICVQLQAG